MPIYRAPKIPKALLHTLSEIVSTGGLYDVENGNQWRPGVTEEHAFSGIVMPLSNEDLQCMEVGTYTVNSQKLYTNGKALLLGAQVRDTYDGKVYTVKQELTHGPVHPMKRYLVETKGGSAAK